jgi:hypothetical protein
VAMKRWVRGSIVRLAWPVKAAGWSDRRWAVYSALVNRPILWLSRDGG